jgi:aquaporin Z
MVFTFVLTTVVLNVAMTKKQEGNSFFGLAIGFTVFLGAVSVGSISGGAFNPAVGTGLPALVAHPADIGVYWLGDMSGGILAALVFRFITAADEDAPALW